MIQIIYSIHHTMFGSYSLSTMTWKPQQRYQERTLLLAIVVVSMTQMGVAFAPSLTRPPRGSMFSRRGLPQTLIFIPKREASWPMVPMREKPSDKDGEGEESEEALLGIDDFLAQKGEREQQQSLFDGGIFPGDFSPSAASEEITVQAATLDAGQPQSLVGFWKLYGSTGKREDVSGRVILRADGQVIGGPTVRQTPGVKWSDPDGLKPVGGEWVVYMDPKNGRARLNMAIVLSHQKRQRLEMDGVVMMVDTFDSETGESKPEPQIFGSVSKRSGDTEVEAGEGDFSMMKIPTGEDKLIASVGSQQRRIW